MALQAHYGVQQNEIIKILEAYPLIHGAYYYYGIIFIL